MQVPDLDAVLGEVVGQLLGHALGERGDEDALALSHPQIYFGKKIIDLGGCRAHGHLGIDQAGRAHHLLDHLRRLPRLVAGGRRRDENRLAHHALELVEPERPIVERRRQPEAVIDQVFLAGTVAAVHAPELTDGDVTLVDDHQRVLRQVVDQRRRRFAWVAA